MKIRLALALTVLLPLMVACKPQDGTADTTAPVAPVPAETAPEPAPAPAEAASPEAGGDETAAAGEEAATPPAPSAPVPASALPVGPAPVAGTDYEVIEGGQPFQPATGKIEVTEIFGYTCPACARFQALVGPWKAGLPADVNVVYVPLPANDYARAYYAAEALGVLDKTHDAMYAAIHLDGTLKGQRGRDSVEDIAAFYGKHGVDAKVFASTMSSFTVVAKANRATQYAQRNKVDSTPTLLVNGKYRVKGTSFEDMLRIADHLIARERAANAQ